jgi:hypothetical protein
MADEKTQKGVSLVYRVDLELSKEELTRLKEVLKYATMAEIARLDASKDLKATPLDTETLGAGLPGFGNTMGFFIA